ncbi:hypothetical protein HDU78_007692 [Chytriomyces hyalinus]|nr:hypothetical protein HDU78_007692 [Chytriomyces hyalinus]
MLLLIVLLTLSVCGALAESSRLGFQISVTKARGNTALVCISGTVPVNTYIGWGIPKNASAPSMIGAELAIVYYGAPPVLYSPSKPQPPKMRRADSKQRDAVQIIQGNGMLADIPSFRQDRRHPLRISTFDSSYKKGVLKTCFKRSMLKSFAKPSAYLLASGPVVEGCPLVHGPNNREVLRNVTLLLQVHALFTVANFTFSATQTNATTALVCITGAVPIDTYIGFGIPFVASEPYMARSDLTIVYATASKSIVQLHGRGMLADSPFYADDAVMERPTTQVPVPGNSSYENGVLKACFSRPLNYTSSSGSEEQVLGNNLVVGNSTYMWSTGQVLDGMALSHMHDDAHRGSVAGVNLFPVVSSTATATASIKNSSTATATAKASSATSNKSSASSTQTARALLNRLLMKRVARRY